MATRPLLVFTGADDYRKVAAARAQLDALVPAEDRDFNLTRLSGRGLDAERLLTAIETPALFAPCRVVEVQDADQLAAAVIPGLVRAIDAALARPEPGVVVLLVYAGDKKPPKDLVSRAEVRDFPRPKRREALDWLRSYAHTQHGRTLGSGVAEALVDAVGPDDSGRLAAELDKLVVFVGDNRPVTLGDIAAATGHTALEAPYALYDCVGLRDFPGARAHLARLLENPDYAGVRITIGLSLHLVQVALARARLDAGESRGAVEQSLGGWFGRKYVEQASAWTLDALDAALLALGDADRELKSGHADRPTLELWLARALVAPAS